MSQVVVSTLSLCHIDFLILDVSSDNLGLTWLRSTLKKKSSEPEFSVAAVAMRSDSNTRTVC